MLPDWFQTPLGASLLEREAQRFSDLLPPAYYGRGLQLGAPEVNFLNTVGVRYPFIANLQRLTPAPDLLTEPDALPFGEKSLELIVLPHTLDFWPDPHAVLREVSQILTPEGCVAITGFNPWSVWGGIRAVRKQRQTGLWSAHFHRMGRMQDWLTLLGFEPVGGAMQVYQPPLQSEKWRRRLHFLDAAGDRWWPGFAAVYILVARRRVPGLRPTAIRSRQWSRLLTGVAQPAARWPMRNSTGGDR